MEHEFRALDDGKMIYMTGSLQDIKRFFRVIREDAILMLYTGLKDKDYRKIYHKDICKIFGRFYVEVIYENGSFGYNDSSGYFISFAQNNNFEWYECSSKKVEKVGNIYENPELLLKE